MKRIILILIFLALNTNANNIYFNEIAIGSDDYTSSPYNVTDNPNNPAILHLDSSKGAYFISPYAGINDIYLYIENTSSISSIQYYNCNLDICTLSSCNLNYSIISEYKVYNTSCYSNIGFYKFSMGANSNFYRELSYINNINKSYRNYIAGSTYKVPILKFYLKNTQYWLYNYNLDSVLYNNTILNSTAGFYTYPFFGYYSESCDSNSELDHSIYTKIMNNSDYSQYISGRYYVNLSAIKDFSIVNYYPASLRIYANYGDIIEFSGIPSYFDAVSASVFYLNGDLVQYNLGYSANSYIYQFNQTGYNYVELQYEDNNCLRYPTKKWEIFVSNGNSSNSTNTIMVYLNNETLCSGTYYYSLLHINNSIELWDNNLTLLDVIESNDGIGYFTNLENGDYKIYSSYNGSVVWYNISINGGTYNIITLNFFMGESDFCYSGTTTTTTTTTTLLTTTTTTTIIIAIVNNIDKVDIITSFI